MAHDSLNFMLRNSYSNKSPYKTHDESTDHPIIHEDSIIGGWKWN